MHADLRICVQAMGASESKHRHHPKQGRAQAPNQKQDAYTFRVIKDSYETTEGVTEALRAAGLESSQLIVGIDFTKSNEWTGKNSFNGRCLHHTGNDGPNPYEHAMSIIAKTLHDFDDDHLIPCYGFGDSTTGDRKVFSFYSGNAPAQGLETAVGRYRQISSLVKLAGPTSFGPLIRQALRDVVNSGNQYHILLILADGQVTPTCTEDTIQAIVEASNYPMSIIMVGVGDGPWDQMAAFDDTLPTRKFDNFQFVNFTLQMERASVYQDDAKREAHFALNALMEIPEQYKAVQALSLMGSRARVPRLDMWEQLAVDPPPDVMAADAAYYGAIAPSAPPFSGAMAPGTGL
eukprot:evm.model.scf_519EXC.6 EVM.evm.TU.scf_519EXC.6   scf_519EXC:41568-42820(-)